MRAHVKEKKKTKIADDAYEALQTQILRGDFAPGDRLPPERELSSQLGTNRNTLREAIRKLEQMRLVTVRQGQGVTVADFRRTGTIDLLEPFLAHGDDLHEKARALADLLSARTVVLGYALELAAQRADSEDIRRMSDIRRLLTGAYGSGDRAALTVGYHQWLVGIVDAAHSLPIRWVANPFLDMNRSFMDRFPSLWVLDEGFGAYLVATEDAIRRGDGASAQAANRAYYDRIDAVVLSMLHNLFSDSAAFSPSGTA